MKINVVCKNKFIVAALCATTIGFSACTKKDDDPAEAPPQNTIEVKPGSLMLELDTAVGSSLKSSGSTLLAFDENTYCSSNGTPEDAHRDDKDYEQGWWRCQFLKIPNGPDTVRGGMTRVKQLLCSVEEQIDNEAFTIDGSEYEVDLRLSADCWGAAFAEMVVEQLPDLVVGGVVVVKTKVTGYTKTAIPSTMTDDTTWDYAFKIIFGISAEETTTYSMLFKDSDNILAGSILDVSTDQEIAAFGASLDTTDPAATTLRYEGRFPNKGTGKVSRDSNFGSRHVKAMITGAYTVADGFTSFDSGYGFSMEMGNSGADQNSNGEQDIASHGYKVKSFTGDTTDLYTAVYQGSGPTISSVEAAAVYPADALDKIAQPLEFTATSDQMAGFLHDKASINYTASTDWHAENGALDFTSVGFGD